MSVALVGTLIFSFVAMFFIGNGAYCSVSATTSDVIFDLQRDSAFDAADYPKITTDFSLQLIQLAESKSDGLILYVYQPSCDGRVIATHVSIAQQANNDPGLSPTLYGLQLLDSDGVFYKYKVVDFHVAEGFERFYNVIMLQRPFIEDVDTDSDTDNTINRKAFTVGQYWRVITPSNGNVIYEMQNVDVIQIIDPFSSYIREKKENLPDINNSYVQDNYYVAFSTDRDIDELLSATVHYRIQDYLYSNNNFLDIDSTIFNEHTTFSNAKYHTKDIYCDELIELDQTDKLFGFDVGEVKTWGRIQSAEEFIETSGAPAGDLEQVQGLQWVLMFDETSAYRTQSDGTIISTCEEAGQCIDDVTVLRLEFVEDGVTYNLGAVSDSVSADHGFGDIDNEDEKPDFRWLAILVLAAGVLAVVVIVGKVKK